MDRSTAPRRAERDLGLDGLRGFAALAVVFAHLVTYTGLFPYPPLGIMGVVLFFALSGYLIGRILWRLEPTAASYRTFLRRRMRRLTPVVLAVVLASSVALLVVGAMSVGRVVREGAAALLQVTALREASGAEVAVVFRPTWSLTVEWVFYLVCPLVIFALKRMGLDARRSRTILVRAGLALYALALPLPAVAFYHLPVANLGVLTAGAALAIGHAGRELDGPAPTKDPAYSAMAMVLLVILVVLPGDSLSWSWKLVVLPGAAAATLVVIHGCWAGVATSRLLSARWLRAVGVRAYSLYLWHLPVMWVVGVTMPSSTPMMRAVTTLVAVSAVVMASYSLLEEPFLSTSGRAHAPARHASRPRHAGAHGPVAVVPR